MPRTRPTILLCALSTLLGGCVYTEGRTVRDVGPQLSKESLAAVEPGKSTTEWLFAFAGEPKTRTTLTDGVELLRYDSDRRTTEGWYIFMLFASSSNTIERTCWWFETKDGVIMRCWGEHCEPVTASPLNPYATEPEPRATAAAAAASAPPATAQAD
ncbi:MAG: hypothetical protein LW636_02050 [Planctomycetaceae bacterium]|nr:hypothetical protein [Planctomycetaceae bacterium]